MEKGERDRKWRRKTVTTVTPTPEPAHPRLSEMKNMEQLSTQTAQKRPVALQFKKSGKRERQEAFIQAYLADAFNISSACRQVGIDRSTYYKWSEDDEFKTKFNDARESRKDFIESKLLERVAKGDTIAIIFACKCLLADRGYVEKTHAHITAETKPVFSKEQQDAAINAMLLMADA
jgi:hypothetical protein